MFSVPPRYSDLISHRSIHVDLIISRALFVSLWGKEGVSSDVTWWNVYKIAWEKLEETEGKKIKNGERSIEVQVSSEEV